MGNIVKKNSTTFIRAEHDATHPFNCLSAELNKLDGYQLAIMSQLLSNNDSWIVNKKEILKRTKFSGCKFEKAWQELIKLGYIEMQRLYGAWHYTIHEGPPVKNALGIQIVQTTCTHTSCMGTPLTNTNINYYNSSTTSTGATCLEEKFKELIGMYPDNGILPNGTHYELKRNLEKCKKTYIRYLTTGEANHEEVISCLQIELQDRRLTGKTTYMPGLQKWLTKKHWERYKGVVIDTSSKYGCDLE